MHYILILTAGLFFLNIQIHAQYIPTLGGHPSDLAMPLWAEKMYQLSPNVWEVESLYQDYYLRNAFEKNKHTQYYKHWRNRFRAQVNEQGFIDLSYPLREYQPEKENRSSDWTYLGPEETRTPVNDHPNNRAVSWQNNIYCLSVSASNPNIIVCGGETGGVHRSADKGIQWTHISANIPISTTTAIQIHPVNPDIIFCANANSIFRTTDAGQNWSVVYSETGFEAVSIRFNAQNPQSIQAAGLRGLLQSNDGGNTWTKQFNGLACWDIQYHPQDSQKIYLLKTNVPQKKIEFLVSSDGGTSFQVTGNGWYNTDAGSVVEGGRLAVTPAAPDWVYAIILGKAFTGADQNLIGFFRSFNRGEDWTCPNAPIGGPYDGATSFNLATANPNGTGIAQGFYDLCLAVSPIDPGVIITGATSCYASYDSGTTFVSKGGYAGGLDWIHPDMQDAQFAPTGELYLATDGGVDYSNDNLQTAESRNRGIRGSDLWGFGQGWNEDVLVGGRYHNGNMAYHENYPQGVTLRMGGAEEPTGYVNPGQNRKVYFSDIGGKLIPEFISQPFGNIPFDINPNESYFETESSELEFDPRCYQHMITGYQNSIWKSTDGGNSFQSLSPFSTNTSDRVLEIEISREQPNIMYCFLRKATGAAGTIYKTTDGGLNWTAIPNPTTGNKRQVSIAMNQDNPDQIWICLRAEAINSLNKVFFFDGTNWINWSSPTLNGTRVNHITHATGTTGGVYLTTTDGVFYRNLQMSDWELMGSSLPMQTNGLKSIPFYRKNKLRLGTYGRGVWEIDLYEKSLPRAQPSVDKLSSSCIRDTFFFSDYSVTTDSVLSRNWSFPGATWFSSLSEAHPRVVYATPGSYNVSLTITDADGNSSSKTLQSLISVTNNCIEDSIPGYALECSPDSSAYAQTSGDFSIESNQFTISGWIKPHTPETGLSGIFFEGNEDVTGLHIENGNELKYHYRDSEWWVSTGLSLDMNAWNYVAMVVTPSSVTLYMNEEKFTKQGNYLPSAIHAWAIGRDPRYGNNRVFDGQIDEFCFWNRALTEEEIRLNRHLTKKPFEDPTLSAYYQFNESNGTAYDKSGTHHALLSSGAKRIWSGVPVGNGVSTKNTFSNAGFIPFANTGLEFVAPTQGTTANGEMVATHIFQSPDVLPDTGIASTYWVLNNYGQNNTYTPITEWRFAEYGPISQTEAQNPSRFTLFRRPENGSGEIWGEPVGYAIQAISGTNGSLAFNLFNGVDSGGQFVISNSLPEPDPVSIHGAKASVEWRLFPNPAGIRGSWVTGSGIENGDICVMDKTGRVIFNTLIRSGQAHLEAAHLQGGIYLVHVNTPTSKCLMKWIVSPVR